MNRFAVATVLLFASAVCLAQDAGMATLAGVVKDPQGAVVGGASVTLTNTATNVARSVRTAADGSYAIPELAPGRYTVAVSAAGFAPAKADLTLRVGQHARLDVPLAVGAEAQTVQVLAEGEVAESRTSTIEGVISTSTIDRLPLNGRNFLELSLLAPGNAPAPNYDPTKTNSVLISSAGQFGRGGNVNVDGSDNNDDVVGGVLHNLPQDSVQEFQIATSRFSADLGRTGSSVINVVTKSGSNDVHGSLSFFYRDDALQALPATFDRSVGEEPPFDRQQYAGTIGGPLVRDKAWFFGGLEYRNQDGAVLVGERDVAQQEIVRTFASAPLDQLLFTTRADWQASDAHSFFFRYSLDRGEDVGASTLIRAIGSASQRQEAENNYQSFTAAWTYVIRPTLLNRFSFSENNFINTTVPVQPGPQLTFPSIQDGASFRVPQQTKQNRLQFSDTLSWVKGKHSLKFGGDFQRIDAHFDLAVFQDGRIELMEDFAPFDRNGDGQVTDEDLLFAVTLRSGFPDQALVLPDTDNNYFAWFVQDDWQLHPQFTLNLGLRYEIDTDVKNISRLDELNPLVLPFLEGTRGKDANNWGPRIGFNWAPWENGGFTVRGGYGIYYDRVTLQVQSLERGLDGRALPIEVRAGNVFFLTGTGTFGPGAPTLSNPFTGFILPGAGAGGINIIDNDLQNPMVQQFNLGLQKELPWNLFVSADYLHTFGTHFILGRSVGTVFNPVVGGLDVVKRLESSAKTKYDGLLLSVRKRYADRFQFSASYTLSKAFNYANDDQIPFGEGPLDPNDLRREYGPTPNDQRHRFVFAGSVDLPWQIQVSPLWTIASGVPMDILLPDASTRVPEFGRNSGGRRFRTAAELNAALAAINQGLPLVDQLPLVSPDARFNDSFNSLDLRLSKQFRIGERVRVDAIGEVFNLFNITNILGVSNLNYSGFNNVLVRDSNDPASAGYLTSSAFGRPVTTAGGVFGSGGPRAFQLGARLTF